MKIDLIVRYRQNRLSAISASLVFVLLCGCQRAPTMSIAGSFFPVWLLSVVMGIVFAAVARFVFIRVGLDQGIRPAILIYPCLALSFALTVWLVLFR